MVMDSRGEIARKDERGMERERERWRKEGRGVGARLARKGKGFFFFKLTDGSGFPPNKKSY